MCPGGQGVCGPGGHPEREDGREPGEDRWKEVVFPLAIDFDCANLVSGNGHAPAAPRSVGYLRNHWQTAQLQQQFP
jgi:hypothetical protein